MKKILLVICLLFIGLSAFSQQGTPGNSIPFSPVPNFRNDRTNIWYDKNTGQFKGRMLDGSDAVIPSISDISSTTSNVASRTPYMTLFDVRHFTQSVNSAPGAINLTDSGKEGVFILDKVDTSTPDNIGTVIVTPSQLRYKRTLGNTVSLSWFDAPNDVTRSAVPAFRKALKVCKNLVPVLTAGGNVVRGTLLVPEGWFLVDSTLNLTNAQGLWIRGTGGPHLNSTLICVTGSKPAIDFSGSNYSGCENLTIRGGGSNANTTQIGVQFALTSNGGLNCGMRNCHIFLLDQSTAVLGSKGVINSRSEEFYIDACTISANTPLVFSYTNDISASGYNYTISSDSAIVSTGGGSMGNVNIQSTSLHGIQRRGPAIILNGTNSVTFKGYIGRVSASVDTVETAILIASGINNFDLEKTTIESYSSLVKVLSCSVQNSEFHGFISSSTTPGRPIFNLIGSSYMVDCDTKISFVVGATRILVYDGGNASQVQNCIFATNGLANDITAVSPGLLKRSDNVTFNTAHPFKKESGVIRQLKGQAYFIGTVNNTITPVTIFSFNEARVSGEGGYYSVRIHGIIKAGISGSGEQSSVPFDGYIQIHQRPNGTLGTITPLTVLYARNTTNATYLTIKDVTLSANIASGVVSVQISPVVTSTGGTGEQINFRGYSEVSSDFSTNDPIPN